MSEHGAFVPCGPVSNPLSQTSPCTGPGDATRTPLRPEAAIKNLFGPQAIVLTSCPSTSLGGFCVAEVEAHITGTVWKIECAVGDRVEEGDTVAILESMKMEMPVEAEDSGTVVEIRCEEGQAVSEGDTLVVLE